MSDLFLLIVIIAFVFVGLKHPYIAFSGYIWVDMLSPQSLTYGFLVGKPLALIIGVTCIVSVFFNVNQLSKLHKSNIAILLLLWVVWVTLTTVSALFPEAAWFKWDSVFKTIFMSILLCFVISSKEQLEHCLIIFTVSIGYYIIVAGLKTIGGNGGYGRILVSTGTNSGLAESSTLAMVAVMVIPLILYLKDHSVILKPLLKYKYVSYLAILLSIAAVIGTGARTGLVALAAFTGIYWLKSQHKVKLFFGIVVCISIAFVFFVNDDWSSRMQTMNNASEDSSAQGRMLVWQWTWDFVKTHPLGGGFGAFRANAGLWQLYADIPIAGEKFKAFHSIYFETLGEHGHIGLIIYLSLIFLSWISNKKLSKEAKVEKIPAWVGSLAYALNNSIIIFCVAGAFIGVASQPVIYYLIVFSIVLQKLAYKKND